MSTFGYLDPLGFWATTTDAAGPVAHDGPALAIVDGGETHDGPALDVRCGARNVRLDIDGAEVRALVFEDGEVVTPPTLHGALDPVQAVQLLRWVVGEDGARWW